MMLITALLITSASATFAAQDRYTGPIIDVNVRADPLSPERLREFERHHVTHAVVFGRDSVVGEWKKRWGSTVLRSVTLPCPARDCYPNGGDFPDTAWLRTELRAGRVQALGELMQQFSGLRPDDPRLEPYFALAEEFDIPVNVHLALAPPWITREDTPFRAYLGRPGLIEDVLARHRKLRVILAHAGFPWADEITSILYMYPGVSVDISAIALPRFTAPGVFHQYLARLVTLGFTDRILFGSDVQDPRATGETVEAIQSAPFLTLEQKRAILCGNARRLFRLEELRCE